GGRWVGVTSESSFLALPGWLRAVVVVGVLSAATGSAAFLAGSFVALGDAAWLPAAALTLWAADAIWERHVRLFPGDLAAATVLSVVARRAGVGFAADAFAVATAAAAFATAASLTLALRSRSTWQPRPRFDADRCADALAWLFPAALLALVAWHQSGPP